MWMRILSVSLLAIFLCGCGGSGIFSGVNDGDRFQIATFTRFDATTNDPNAQISISGQEQISDQIQCYANRNTATCQKFGYGGGQFNGQFGGQYNGGYYGAYNPPQYYNPNQQYYNPNQQYYNPNQQYNPNQPYNQFGYGGRCSNQQGGCIVTLSTFGGASQGSIRVYFFN